MSSKRLQDTHANGQLRFADIVEVNPKPDRPQLQPDDLVSFIPMSDVSNYGTWAIRQNRRYAEVNQGYTPIREGDILFAKITPCTQNGKGCHALGLTGGVGFGSTEFHVLRAKPGVNPRLAYHLSLMKEVRVRAVSMMGGSAGQQRVPADFFEVFRLPPSILEHQELAAELYDAWTDAIEQTRGVIAQTRRLKTALLQDLLTHGLPGRHSKFKQVRGLGTVPASWDIVRLDELAKVDRGKFTHRPRNDPKFYGGDIPFVQTGDVAAAGDYLMSHSQTLNELGLSISRMFPAGTILFVIAGSVGEPTIASYDVAFPDSVVGITPKRDINPLFLLRVLQFAQARIIRTATESAQANISLELLRPLPMPRPEKEEREMIATILRTVEQRIEGELTTLRQLTATKSALSQALLTGAASITMHTGATA